MFGVSRLGGASQATRLLALVVVPITAVSVLALERIDGQLAAADRADGLVQTVGLQRAVAAVQPPAQLERIALEGLARVDELGIPRDLVVTWTGLDFEGTYSSNLEQVDDALDELGSRLRAADPVAGAAIADRLEQVRGELATQRALSATGEATPGELEQVFEELDAVLVDALAHARPGAPTGPTIDRRQAGLDALAGVLVSAGVHADTVLRGVLEQTDELRLAMVATRAAHEARLDAFADTLDAGARGELAAVRAGLAPIPGELLAPAGDGAGSLITDPALVTTSATTILDQLAYLEALEDYSAGFHDEVAADVAMTAAGAQSDVTRTRVLLYAIAVVTIVVLAVVMWTTLVPIRRLTRRGMAINRGDLDLDPLPVRGPGDIRALTVTMNEMLATLHRVDVEIHRLAAGDITGRPPDLPGAIGDAMRESVLHLSAVTARLQRSEQLSSAIVAQAADAIWTVGGDGTIRTANAASAELTGIAGDDQRGRAIHELLSRCEGEAVITHASGRRSTVLVANSVVDIGHEHVVVVIAHDISERSRFEARLAHQARHDALTGLPNRYAVLHHLEQAVEHDDRDVAVLFIDLDSFKSVNDTRGHSVGDRVLIEIAARLSRCVRSGEFVGRLGGDEFVVIAHGFTEVADVVALGERIIREIELPQSDDDQIFALSASVGIAIAAPSSSAIDTIRHADNALYQAKHRGRGRVELFDASLQARVEQLAALELALRHAVRNDELVVHLQPILDLASGRFGGAEALVRWQRPGYGMVPPNDFIPIAERSPLIVEIDCWVLTTVCHRLVEWRRQDPTCSHRVAVNISGRHLTDGDLVADVDAALLLTGADPTMLELELTETHLLEDIDRAIAVLTELRRRGITIAVDDFGTGYSSMAYLRHLPIDVLKIDRSFVSHATEDGYDSTVIEALLTIGRTLQVAVVAEGVETGAQLDHVRARGCDRAQGFVLARPMPIQDAEALIFGAGTPAGVALSRSRPG